MSKRLFYVYILTNFTNSVLYVGVTNNVFNRSIQHKAGFGSEFTTKYKITKLVYFESLNTPLDAIKREKQLKAGSRQKKIDLINELNPKWEDLFEKLFH